MTAGSTFTLRVGTQLQCNITVTPHSSANGTVTPGQGHLSAGTYAVGTVVNFTLGAGGSSPAGGQIIIGATSVAVDEQASVRVIGVGTTEELNSRILSINTAITTLRSRAQVLSSNAAILNNRLSFTKDYVSTLLSGADKLTLADLNEEGSNLLAVQTRQQLGIQALAFAGKSEQSILGIFRWSSYIF